MKRKNLTLIILTIFAFGSISLLSGLYYPVSKNFSNSLNPFEKLARNSQYGISDTVNQKSHWNYEYPSQISTSITPYTYFNFPLVNGGFIFVHQGTRIDLTNVHHLPKYIFNNIQIGSVSGNYEYIPNSISSITVNPPYLPKWQWSFDFTNVMYENVVSYLDNYGLVLASGSIANLAIGGTGMDFKKDWIDIATSTPTIATGTYVSGNAASLNGVDSNYYVVATASIGAMRAANLRFGKNIFPTATYETDLLSFQCVFPSNWNYFYCDMVYGTFAAPTATTFLIELYPPAEGNGCSRNFISIQIDRIINNIHHDWNDFAGIRLSVRTSNVAGNFQVDDFRLGHTSYQQEDNQIDMTINSFESSFVGNTEIYLVYRNYPNLSGITTNMRFRINGGTWIDLPISLVNNQYMVSMTGSLTYLVQIQITFGIYDGWTNSACLAVQGIQIVNLYAKPIHETISSIYINDVSYSVGGVNFVDDLTMHLISRIPNPINAYHAFYIYEFDGILPHYNGEVGLGDLILPSQQYKFHIDIKTGFTLTNFNSNGYIEGASNVIPSSIDLRCNGNLISDLTISSGYIQFNTYQNQLIFSCVGEQTYFNCEIRSDFDLDYTLDVISPSYMSKILTLNAQTSLIVDEISISFEGSIFHNYINNFDYGINKIIHPSEIWNINLKHEVITEDFQHIYLTEFNPLGNSLSDSFSTNVKFNSFNFVPRSFDCWYIPFPESIDVNSIDIGYSDGISGIIPLDYEIWGNFWIINHYLEENWNIYIDWYIDPKFETDIEVIEQSNFGTKLTLSYRSNIVYPVSNILIKTEVPRYYENWDLGTIDIDKIFTLNNRVTFTNEWQYIEINGNIPNPIPVNLITFFTNTYPLFQEGFDDQLEITSYIEFPSESFVWEIIKNPSWTLLGIFQGDNEIEIYNGNTFFGDFSDLTNDVYLKFSVNPIKSFIVNRDSKNVIIIIDCDIPLENQNILFGIDNTKNYRMKSEGVIKVLEQSNIDYYKFSGNLKAGLNEFVFDIEEYSNTSWSNYVWLFLLLGGMVGIVLYLSPKMKKSWALLFKRKNKKEK